MIYKSREQFYTGREWRKTSKAYAKSKGLLCERCLKKGIIVPYEEVHHKIRITMENINNPEITLSWNNLECLCKACHESEHRADAKERPHKKESWKKWNNGRRYIVNKFTGKVIATDDNN